MRLSSFTGKFVGFLGRAPYLRARARELGIPFASVKRNRLNGRKQREKAELVEKPRR
jgi:hypothetical protein